METNANSIFSVALGSKGSIPVEVSTPHRISIHKSGTDEAGMHEEEATHNPGKLILMLWQYIASVSHY